MISFAIGLLLTVIGLLMIKFFPDISDYQNAKMTSTGILIAVILIIVGFGMMFLGWFYG
jgi:hypothetical protein